MLDWKDVTNEMALVEWDKGGIVWSCSMGGLGPGYEQVIQIMGFEMLRAMLDNPVEDWTEFDKPKNDKWKDYCDKIENVPKVKAVIEKLQPSGAQFGAAMNLATVFARYGYHQGMTKVPKDRRIQVSKEFSVRSLWLSSKHD